LEVSKEEDRKPAGIRCTDEVLRHVILFLRIPIREDTP
jgi:hypothetical protein